jgi:DNA-binding transcriptional ArsR family regulator
MSLDHPNQHHNPNTAPGSDKLSAALDYADQGMPVFPCVPEGKAPLTQRGHLDASTDPDQLRAWWRRWPEANIGVPTGERSGILALDVDHPAALDALEDEHGKLTTRTHSTGSGGMHLLFAYPPCQEIRNSAGKLGEHLDVRGEGGYIIVPPSSTTRPYQLLDDLPRADTPAWLIEALTRPQGPRFSKASATTTAIVADLDGGPIPAGARDDTITRIAGRLHDGTRSLDELAAELLEVNAVRCQPPLPRPQVEKISRSIHARTPCTATRRTTPETVEALKEIEGRLWRLEWRGMGELSARDVYVALLLAGRTHGELIPAGVRVSISVRALALAAAVSKRTAHYALKRLKSAGVVRADNSDRTGTKSGALVLLSEALDDNANLHHSTTGGRRDSSGASLRSPRLRWSAPAIRRLGKSCGAVLDALDRRGGTATLDELADDLHKTRTWDLRRRVIARLEAAQVVECSEDTVALARDWIDALNAERENAGEIAVHRRDMARFAREREAYANRDSIRPDPVPERPPEEPAAAGRVEELEPVEDADPELVEVLTAYLDRNPDAHPDNHPPEDRRMRASLLASDLWRFDLLPTKPTLAAVELALAELVEVAA